MRQLRDQQVRFAPRERKLQQADNAEKLLAEIDPAKTYTFEYLCFRITDYRPEVSENTKMSGKTAGHDIRLLVEDLFDAANVRVDEMPEPVHTVEDLSSLFNVSTKTISRWRQQGLVSRRFLVEGRKRVGFLNHSVERFVNNNRKKIARGEKFSQLSNEEKNEIIEMARRLAHEGQSLSEVTRRIASKMGRSVETIRYTLKQFDQKNPNLAVFPDQAGPLTEESKTRIYQQYRRGTSVEVLAKRHGRTRASIYRIINEMRAKLLAELPLDFIDNPDFHNPANDAEFTAPLPEPETATRRPKVPSGLPPYLASLYEVPLLTREQEQHLFRKFNYLKCKAAKLRDKVDVSRAKSRIMDEIEGLYQQAVEVKNKIVQSNLRLVVSIAKRHVNSTDDFFTLISDGNMSLIRAAEKFDYARGNKFSTYASWAIMKNFARTIPEEYKIRDRFRTGGEEMFTAAPDERTDQYEQEAQQNVREKQINLILSKLDEREQKIIISRFGLDHSHEPQTLKEVGADLGVTKERVRQIEARALHKLRAAAKEEHIELPD